jgi:hypothetical protein
VLEGADFPSILQQVLQLLLIQSDNLRKSMVREKKKKNWSGEKEIM